MSGERAATTRKGILLPGTIQQSVITRLTEIARDASAEGLLVPIEAAPLIQAFSEEVVRLASSSRAYTLITDATLLKTSPSIQDAIDLASSAYVLAGDSADVRAADHIVYHSGEELLADNENVLVCASDNLQIALVFKVDFGNEENTHRTTGYWTNDSDLVAALYNQIVSETGHDPAPLPTLNEAASHSTLLQLVGKTTKDLQTREHHAVEAHKTLSSVLEILKVLSAKRRADEVVFVFTEEIAANLAVDRCSIVRAWQGDSIAHVLASHEDASIRDVELDLEKYPEITKVLKDKGKVVVNNVQSNPLTADCKDALRSAGITAIAVVPILLFDPQVGSMVLRVARRGGSFSPAEISFCEIVAESAANALERADLIENIQRANRELQSLARTDGLTGLYNQRYFKERLEEEVSRAARYDFPLACMFIDVDYFKKFNDIYGHLVGDGVLKEISKRTSASVRTNDFVARYGGEELVILLPHTDRVGAIQHATRLLRTISDSPYPDVPNDKQVTISVGISMLGTDKTKTSEELLAEADAALYRAKEGGRNRVFIEEEEHLP